MILKNNNRKKKKTGIKGTTLVWPEEKSDLGKPIYESRKRILEYFKKRYAFEFEWMQEEKNN